MKVTVVACGDAFTVAIGAGEAEASVSWAAAGPGFLAWSPCCGQGRLWR